MSLFGTWPVPGSTTPPCGYWPLLAQARHLIFLLHRHFAVQHGRAGLHRLGHVDDRIGIDAVVAIEVGDAAGLAKALDPERVDAMAAHAAEPAERRRMTVEHGDDAALARQRREQSFNVTQML